MQNPDAKTLFQLQSELVDTKVELYVNNANQRVVDQIISLKEEMHREIGGLRKEMSDRFSHVESRLSPLEITFKLGWGIAGSLLTYVVLHFSRWIS